MRWTGAVIAPAELKHRGSGSNTWNQAEIAVLFDARTVIFLWLHGKRAHLRRELMMELEHNNEPLDWDDDLDESEIDDEFDAIAEFEAEARSAG